MKTAVVIGSTGLVGQLVVKKLVREGVFGQIVAISRSLSSSSDLVFSNPKVRVLQFDFQNWNNLELQISSFAGTSPSSFFCCLGTTLQQARSEAAFKKVDSEYVVNFAKLAKNCHAEQLLIISALGADAASRVFYNKTKGEMEAEVRRIFSAKLHFLRPSLLLGDRNDFRLVERLAILLAPLYSPLLIGSWKKYRPISAEKVAQAMVSAATKKIPAELVLENDMLLKIK